MTLCTVRTVIVSKPFKSQISTPFDSLSASLKLSFHRIVDVYQNAVPTYGMRRCSLIRNATVAVSSFVSRSSRTIRSANMWKYELWSGPSPSVPGTRLRASMPTQTVCRLLYRFWQNRPKGRSASSTLRSVVVQGIWRSLFRIFG